MRYLNLKEFLEIIQNTNPFPEYSQLDIKEAINFEEISALINALQSEQCPSNIAMRLYQNDPGNGVANAVIKILQVEPFPHGLKLEFHFHKLDPEEGCALAKVLSSRKYPDDFSIEIKGSPLEIEAAEAFAEALQTGQCPKNLKFTFENVKWFIRAISSSHEATAIAKAFAKALISGKCPPNLTINLRRNEILHEGIEALINTLQSGNCPENLCLVLDDNLISNNDMIAFAHALKSGKCPPRLTLSLHDEILDIEVLMAFADALKSGKCPPDLRFYLSSCSHEDDKILQDAWKVYQALPLQEKFLQCVVLQHGQQQAGSPFNRLPESILKEIQRYVFPTIPVSAKMLEISAKVFLEQNAAAPLNVKTAKINQLDTQLAAALSAKGITQKTEKINEAVESFLQAELGTLQTGKFMKSSTVALLCKYHLIAKNKIIKDPNMPEDFQLAAQLSNKPKL